MWWFTEWSYLKRRYEGQQIDLQAVREDVRLIEWALRYELGLRKVAPTTTIARWEEAE